MGDTSSVQCPYCFEEIELWIDPETSGSFIEDCEVCCRPWQVSVARESDGSARVVVARAQ